jgi:hypothetical protein
MNDDLRRVLKHPRAGGFRSTGSVEWPRDSFTANRLRDGDVKLVEKKEEEEGREQAPHQSRRAARQSDSEE